MSLVYVQVYIHVYVAQVYHVVKHHWIHVAKSDIVGSWTLTQHLFLYAFII